jgi:hypothetical protein
LIQGVLAGVETFDWRKREMKAQEKQEEKKPKKNSAALC